jgi:hypothetical protein
MVEVDQRRMKREYYRPLLRDFCAAATQMILAFEDKDESMLADQCVIQIHAHNDDGEPALSNLRDLLKLCESEGKWIVVRCDDHVTETSASAFDGEVVKTNNAWGGGGADVNDFRSICYLIFGLRKQAEPLTLPQELEPLTRFWKNTEDLTPANNIDHPVDINTKRCLLQYLCDKIHDFKRFEVVERVFKVFWIGGARLQEVLYPSLTPSP